MYPNIQTNKKNREVNLPRVLMQSPNAINKLCVDIFCMFPQLKMLYLDITVVYENGN